jgi:hypothetical protein
VFCAKPPFKLYFCASTCFIFCLVTGSYSNGGGRNESAAAKSSLVPAILLPPFLPFSADIIFHA